MTYDSHVYELVELFLSDNPEKNNEANRATLAEHIQEELENWIEHVLKAAGEPQ